MSYTNDTPVHRGALNAEVREPLATFRAWRHFDDTPLWQRRGVVVRWEEFAREGMDPRTGAVALATRRRIVADDELPTGDAFRRRAAELLGEPVVAVP